MRFYDNTRNALRITFLAFLLVAFGYIIQNENVNIFYTFSNPVLLVIAEGSLRLGKTIIMNLPIIFMVNLVCKKANSGFPIILALISYFTFMVTMSLFASQTLPSYVYNTALGSAFEIAGVSKPYETGLIGAILVSLVTKFAYVTSRQKNRRSLLSFLNNDSAAIIYALLGSIVFGLLIAYLFPIGFELLQKAITYIGANLADSRRLALYGLFDRVLSILGLNKLIRYPFWYTSVGGSYQSILTGEIVVGDVNIWNYIQDASSTYVGAGRFITPYYIINIFIVPAIYLGMYFSMFDNKEKAMHLFPLIIMIALSILCGNPLPIELTLLVTAPLLLVVYLGISSILFWYLSSTGIFLGFSNSLGDIVTAMPGSFPDYIINIRNIKLSESVSSIFVIGLVVAAIMFAVTMIYYNFLAYDIARTGKIEETGNEIIDAVGGLDNIVTATNSVLRISIQLYDLELSSTNRIQKLKARRIVETKDGISMDIGASSCIVARYIRRRIKKDRN